MLVFKGFFTNLLTGGSMLNALAKCNIENGHLFAGCHDEPGHVSIFCIKLLYFRFSIEVEMKSTLHVCMFLIIVCP